MLPLNFGALVIFKKSTFFHYNTMISKAVASVRQAFLFFFEENKKWVVLKQKRKDGNDP